MKVSWRPYLSLFVALIFCIAAMPGSMADTPAMSHDLATSSAMPGCAAMEMVHCHHMKSAPVKKAPGKPCKNMAACMGMLTCFGMGALVSLQPHPYVPSRDAPIAIAHQTLRGLSLRPDNPPPIA